MTGRRRYALAGPECVFEETVELAAIRQLPDGVGFRPAVYTDTLITSILSVRLVVSVL
jgi:hypothetical protein